jgi:predicted MFS family arabinose efflux permease
VLATCLQSILVIQLFVEDTSRRFALEEDWLGLLVSAETGAGALASLIVFLRPHLWRKSIVLVAGGLLFLGNIASALVESPDTLMAARFFMGLGAGIVCSWAYRQTVFYADSARIQGVGVMAQAFSLMIAFALVPRLVEHLDAALYWVNGVLFALMLLGLWLVEDRTSQQRHTEQTSGETLTQRPGVWVSVLFAVGVVSMYASHGAFDTFIAELGADAGVTLIDIGNAMLAACVIGIPAGAMATYIGAKLGVNKPLLLSVIAMLAGVALLGLNVMDTLNFWWVALLYNFGWVLSFPFIVLAADYLNDGGRMASALLMLQALGMAIGALTTGLLAVDVGVVTTLVVFIPIVLTGSLLSFYFSARVVAR